MTKNPKKFRKKAIGLSLAFMLVISGIVPANVFAGTESGASESAKNPAAQQEAEAGTEKGAEKGTGKTEKSARQDARAGNDKDVPRDEAGADVNDVSDVSKEEKGTAERDSKLTLSGTEDKENARAYLVENYITKDKKVITTGGDGIIKSSDGLTYTIGTKTSSGSSITSIRLKTEGTSSSYKSGWYIDSDNPYIVYKKPSATASRAIKGRPASDYSFKATLKLFAARANNADIDNGTAEALASQEFTFILKAEAAKPKVNFKPVDKDSLEAIENAKVTVEYNWSPLSPEADGSYVLDSTEVYTVKASADGYKNYSNMAYTPAAEGGAVELPMEKIRTSRISFNIKDSNGDPVSGATVKVQQGYYGATVEPQSDGTYNLVNGESYSYTVSAANYRQVTGNITPTEDKTIDLVMTKNISRYKVIFEIKDEDGNSLTGAAVTVTDDEDDIVTPETDGTYILLRGWEYTYSAAAEGYKTETGTITPSGDNEKITKTITLRKSVTADPKDTEKVNKINEKFNKEFGALRPDFAKDKNVNEMVLGRIQGYSELDTAGVTVEVASTADSGYIKEDGTIAYVKNDLSPYGNNSRNISCSFRFRCNGAEAVSDSRTVTVCWDRDYYNEKINSEAGSLSWDTIKNGNADMNAVETDLTLPQIMTGSARTAWSNITWTSSNPGIISIEDTGYGSIIDPKKGKVTPAEEDTEVTLTAEFKANDSALNSYVEKPEYFTTVKREFKLTVKGSGGAPVSEESLLEILNKYYTVADLQDFVSKKPIDPDKVDGDIQLPRYTRIKDENGKLVFANKEITVSSSSDKIIQINGYRANVDIFAGDKDIEDVDLIITFTRGGITVKKTIPLKILTITDEALDKELAMMDKAKANYFAGINDNRYKNPDSVNGDLHPFKEMVLDESGNPVWIYNEADVKGDGIKADGYFDDTWEMEANGYNLFRSSDNSVIKHENLVVSLPDTPKKVTITSWLSSARYGKYAPLHPDNEKLQKLYKQETSVEVTVTNEVIPDNPPVKPDPSDKPDNTDPSDKPSDNDKPGKDNHDSDKGKGNKDSQPKTDDRTPVGALAAAGFASLIALMGIGAAASRRRQN